MLIQKSLKYNLMERNKKNEKKISNKEKATQNMKKQNNFFGLNSAPHNPR